MGTHALLLAVEGEEDIDGDVSLDLQHRFDGIHEGDNRTLLIPGPPTDDNLAVVLGEADLGTLKNLGRKRGNLPAFFVNGHDVIKGVGDDGLCVRVFG